MFMRKLLTASLLLALAVFQYQIWFGGSSVRALNALQQSLDEQRATTLELHYESCAVGQ